ncbi:MarR family transcriptional regulator [Rhodocytophaga aerolata]|uniref:MarR family transcriptional regulator n=1 Tax=Rhodocytophaga aerolata TaxID=455078 RepID=A0ABT8QY83_9BACT|nr:MarR family transcriptional regulator [Rhodocytophaga aerolata]MDO1444801.1 MarR family transcriptional regulator [Rhodocytophaga aerolata]
MKIEEEICQQKFRSDNAKAVVNILFTSSWLTNKVNQLLKPFGISVEQYNVLRILKGQYPNPATLGVVQERMLEKMSNATRLVDKLITKGMVDRKQCPANRRAVDIRITEKGLHVLEEIAPLMLNLEKSLGLCCEEAQHLNFLLDKLRG